MDSFDHIVTGEAVAIEARPASVMTRAVATLLDFLFLFLLLILLLVMFDRKLVGLNSAQLATLTTFVVVALTVAVPTAVETLTRGRSLGKLIMGTRVVRDDGGPIQFRHALTRWASAPIELVITAGLVAFIASSVNKRSKRLGDLAAGTYVARVSGVESYDAPILCPPELAGWAAQADMRQLPDRVSLYARKFLARTGSMTPQVREQMAISLAAQVEKSVAPRPPAGTHPERFLAAVVATRRDREYAVTLDRMERDAQEGTTSAALPFGIS